MFLLGLQKLGKGDWRGIARNFVVSRTPTQVASHAQKYFIRQTNSSRRKRRSSLFDMIPEMVYMHFLIWSQSFKANTFISSCLRLTHSFKPRLQILLHLLKSFKFTNFSSCASCLLAIKYFLPVVYIWKKKERKMSIKHHR